MKFYQTWVGCLDDGNQDFFEVKVPGNFQDDYSVYKEYGDIWYGYNCQKLKWLEDYGCIYQTELDFDLKENERLFFVSKGIDYEYEIFVNGQKVYAQEGMFAPVDIDISDYLNDNTVNQNKNVLTVKIAKPPKAPVEEKDIDSRNEARECVKPAVSYGWDFHPRVIPTGIWDETYLETRGKGYITNCEAFYELNNTLTEAVVRFEIDCKKECMIQLKAPDMSVIYEGTNPEFVLKNPMLWWCNGQGDPNLYTYRVSSDEDVKEGTIGFRKVELVMNEGAWDGPTEFPKTRSVPPITLRLNNRCIFAKGSNWVCPEIFYGRITRERYAAYIQLMKEANMNILRSWGGAIVNKESFFDLCDELGIMVWQEFPLACNNYTNDDKYLSVLEHEAIAIVQKIRRHPSHVIWCSGNELFNVWSGMTEQSLAIRLLNKICYQYDRKKPYMPTSPLMGMAHGYYMFYDIYEDKDIMQMMNVSNFTAYTEFGVSAINTPEIIHKIIPEDEINCMEPGTAWEVHHAFNVWEEDSWIAKNTVEHFFGKQDSVEAFAECSWMMQCAGLKGVYEEARRQRPYCSMAINWDFDEPWYTAAGSNLVTYDAIPKPAYYAVKESLRPVLASARVTKFEHYFGENFTAELWLLNDSQDEVEDTIGVYIVLDGREEFLLQWETGKVGINANKKGPVVQYVLPKTEDAKFTLILKSQKGYGSEYRLLNKEKPSNYVERVLN